MSLKNGMQIKWPGNKKIALMVTFDFDVEWLRYSREHRKPLGFADKSRGHYGVDEGLRRCLKVLDNHKIKGTFFVPGRVVEDYPEQVKMIAEKGHELAYHGYAHEDDIDMTCEQEEQNMIMAENAFMNLLGKKPIGARGCWNMTYEFTPDLLMKRGYKYSSIMKNCDYAWLYPGDKETELVELPVDHTLDDYTFFFFTFNSPQHRSNYPVNDVLDYWKDTFDELCEEEDKIMVLKLHPQLIGRASRSVMLDNFLKYASDHGAWIATCEDVAEYVIKNEEVEE